MTFDIQTLNQYKQDGLLISQSHPTLPLIVWNYTAKVQYENLWDEITIAARGLVTDLDGNIVSKGFPKFWNLEENRHTPTDTFEVYGKLDGQYIGVFWYNNELVVNSRGSFTSPYAVEARRILDENHQGFLKYPIKTLTYCFELVGFEQIVVNYPKPDLVLTGIFNIHGTEWFDELKDNWNLSYAMRYSGFDYTQIKQFNWQNAEGFVVRFSNGSRCKVKFEDYVKLHRQMTNLSTTAVWEALRDGKPVSTILNDVPDEFYDKVHRIETALNEHYKALSITLVSKFKLKKMICGLDTNRKRFAEEIKDDPHKHILFSMYDNKDYSKHIWNLIKPKYEKI